MQPTYTGGRAERAYLHDCLEEFFEDQLLTDILAKVKGGKEANVYCCQGKDGQLIAAKVYRPPEFRAMKNDWVYRLGRGETDATGKAARDSREKRAMANRTRFGKELRSGSWIYSEVAALDDCYGAGVTVPELIAHSERVLLMQYLGDAGGPAPMLHGQRMNAAIAGEYWRLLRADIAAMLRIDRIHGDLSPYNVMLFEGRPWIIDLPQTVHPLEHPDGYGLLRRDVDRLCKFFSRQGIYLDADEETHNLWREEFG